MIPFADVTDAGRQCVSIFYDFKFTIIFKDNFEDYAKLLKYLAAGMDKESIALIDKFHAQQALVLAVSAHPEQLTVERNTSNPLKSESVIKIEGFEVAGEFERYLNKAAVNGGDISYLKRFFERLAQNPDALSRKQLYKYIENHGILIADDGYMVIYKSVNNKDGEYLSTQQGYGIVNGEVFQSAYLNNAIGNTVEIPREKADSNPNASCSTGLHVGAYRYVGTFSNTLLAVKVNPRDVVSVPHDANAQKIRVCKYTVLAKLSGKEIPDSVKNIPVKNDGDETAITAKPIVIEVMKSEEAAQSAEITLEDYFANMVKDSKFKKKGRNDKLFENRAAFLAHFYANVPLSESDKNKLRKRTAKLFPAEDHIKKEHITNLYNLHYTKDVEEKK